ncbi:hypothetical protein C8Q78DRAFT_1035971 [Trametes maxima]|nr:hypothetical protein C8Q78DRAFT_1035971 [Trametes maxima]
MLAVACALRRAFISWCLRATPTVHSLAGRPHLPWTERSPGASDTLACIQTRRGNIFDYGSIECRTLGQHARMD